MGSRATFMGCRRTFYYRSRCVLGFAVLNVVNAVPWRCRSGVQRLRMKMIFKCWTNRDIQWMLCMYRLWESIQIEMYLNSIYLYWIHRFDYVCKQKCVSNLWYTYTHSESSVYSFCSIVILNQWSSPISVSGFRSADYEDCQFGWRASIQTEGEGCPDAARLKSWPLSTIRIH